MLMGRSLIKFTLFCAGIALPQIASASLPYGLTFVDFGSISAGPIPQNAPGVHIQNAQQTTASDSFNLTQGGAIANLNASIAGNQFHLDAQTVAGPGLACCTAGAGV